MQKVETPDETAEQVFAEISNSTRLEVFLKRFTPVSLSDWEHIAHHVGITGEGRYLRAQCIGRGLIPDFPLIDNPLEPPYNPERLH